MSDACAIAVDMGVVRDVLSAVHCNTHNFAQLGYRALTAAESPFQTALTIFLTIYVAGAGYRLLFATGGARLSDGPGMALKIGIILALVTNWSVFQTLVFDVAARAPLQIAALISTPLDDGGSLASDPIEGLQFAYDRLSTAAAGFDKPATPAADSDRGRHAAAAQALWLASGALVAASAGVIAVVTIAIGILTAIGPVFILLSLFLETRGFFVGWVRALSAAAFALLTSWTLIALMLSALQSWLEALDIRTPAGLPDVQIAITTSAIVFVFAASELGLLLAGIVIARGFRLGGSRREEGVAPSAAAETSIASKSTDRVSRAMALAGRLQSRDGPSLWMGRASAAAAAAGTMQSARSSNQPATQTPRLGDLYRRPAPAKPPSQRSREPR